MKLIGSHVRVALASRSSWARPGPAPHIHAVPVFKYMLLVLPPPLYCCS